MALTSRLLLALLVVLQTDRVQCKTISPTQPTRSVLENALGQYELLQDVLLRPELKEVVYKLEQLDKQHRGSTCGADITTVLTALLALEPWAINIASSFGVPPSSILKGNLWWTGSQSACINAKQPRSNMTSGEPIRGRYCWLKFQPTEALLKVLHGTKTVEMGTAICTPKSCTQRQILELSLYLAETVSYRVAEQYINITGVSCLDTYYTPWTSWKICFRILLLVFLVALVGLGTFMDIRRRFYTNLIQVDSDASSPLARILIAFSVYTNTKRLFRVEEDPGGMQVIKALKVLAMLRIIFVYIYVVILPMSANMNDIVRLADGVLVKTLSQVSLPVDVLFLTNGLQVTYKFLAETNHKSNQISWSKYFMSRYIRITAPLFLVVWFLYGSLGMVATSGPLTFARRFEYEVCEHNSWQNLLYINNFFPPETMCASHTWFLAADMQMFILISLILYSLARLETLKAWFIAAVAVAAATGYASRTVYLNDIPLTDGFWKGDDVTERRTKPLFTELDVKPYIHVGVYVVGVACGWLLYKTRCEAQINKACCVLAWTALILVGVFFLVDIPDPVNIVWRILYLTLGRIIFALAVAWIIFACASGYGGFVNTVLSHGWWAAPSRLTLCAYLLHIPIMLTLLGSHTEVPFFLSHPNVIHLLVGQIVLIYVGAMIVAVTVEKPVHQLEKLFLFPRQQRVRPKRR